MTIWFDMDGTIADLYGCDNWLADLIDGYTRPYREAKSLVNMRKLGRVLNELQENGFEIGVISWLSRGGSEEYGERVKKAKLNWLARHIGAVEWNEIHIVPYGTPKENFCKSVADILFDDEQKNRDNWSGVAYDVNNILEVLEGLR